MNIRTGILLALIVSTIGCSDEFLERTDYYKIDNESYYQNEKDINEALTGAYSVLPVGKGNTNPILLSMVLSDDVLGGGDGAGDSYIRLVDQFQPNTQEDVFEPLWRRYYEGIFRVNSIIDNMGQAVYENPENANRDLGEAYFLRGFMYYELTKFFGTVPLITTPLSGNEPRAEVDMLFAQIASDLKLASELLPEIKFNDLAADRDGHVTKWAAEGLIGRVFLFYTGTYNKSELPLVEGGAITKADAIKYIEDVRDNSGHGLVTEFPNLWIYSATGLKETVVLTEGQGSNLEIIDSAFPANKFVQDGGYKWVGDTGLDDETIWAFKFNTYGNEDEGDEDLDLPRANHMVLFMGVRNAKSVPHGMGWGYCTVHPNLWNDYDEDDVRKYGSMFNVEDATSAELEGTTSAKFIEGKKNYTGYHVTGVFNKKWMPVQDQLEDPTKFSDLWILRGLTPVSRDFSFVRPIPIIRYADILLMHSELTETADGMNLVRNRAGLENTTYTADNILTERRHELAFEGQRYWDLMRTHKLEEAFAYLASNPIKVADGAFGEDGSYPDSYGENSYMESRKFVQIPESQVRLSAGVLEQNEGWK